MVYQFIPYLPQLTAEMKYKTVNQLIPQQPTRNPGWLHITILYADLNIHS